MSSDPKTSDPDYASQLLSFESQLSETMSDASLRQDVFMAIRRLLQENEHGERDVRRLIMERFNSGQMRQETLMVLEKMLERVIADSAQPVAEPGDTVVLEPKTDVADAMLSERANVPANDSLADADHPKRDAAASRKGQPMPGTVLRERYLLQTRVSGGSMGVVFKALDRRLAEVENAEPWVAVKVLAPALSRTAEGVRVMQQEAVKGRCLTHANIVSYQDLDRDDDTYFIVMEWIEGRSLAQILDDPDTNKLSQTQILAIAQQLGEALEYAHQCGVVHADVKPANVMMKSDGQIKLIDFGIARMRQQHQLKHGDLDARLPGAATPAYSSMQVLTGEEPSPADDVFSLACLVYRMIAGYRVFGPRNAREAAEGGMSPQQPNGLSNDAWKVLKKALSFARVARYSSPREFVNDLAAAYQPKPEEPIRAPAKELDAHLAPKRRFPWAAAVILLLGGGAFAAWQSGLLVLPPLASGVPSAGTEIETLPAPVDDSPAVVNDSPSVSAPLEESASATLEELEVDVTELLAPAAEDAAPDVTSDDAVDPLTASAVSAVTEETPGDIASDVEETPADAPADPDSTASTPASVSPQPSADSIADVAPTVEPPAPVFEPLLGTPTHRLVLAGNSVGDGSRIDVVLRENGPGAIVDIVRPANDRGIELIVEEVNFTGNRTDLTVEQYSLSNDGWVRFGAGQDVSQLAINMTPDPAREADLRAELLVRDAATGEAMGALNVVLEDDDQRAFEARIAPNTVGFAVSQVSVSEGQTAAQVDVVRYRPDASALEIGFMVQDVTATEDEDYFPPVQEKIQFGPNERSARILVPLVQDSVAEGDEAFFIELTVPSAGQDAEIFRRIAVMIRDDDS